MTLRVERSRLSPLPPFIQPAFALLLATLASAAHAQNLPPRTQWHASASSQQVPAMAISHLIDGDPKTVTGGAFSPGHWFQIDLGAPTMLAGARITWDVSNPEGYSLQTSLDGTQWQTAYTMTDSLGDVETLYFAPRQARFLRLASPQRTSDWGVSIFEMEPLDSTLSARIISMQRRQPRSGKAAAPSRFQLEKVDRIRSRSCCLAPSPRPVSRSTGPMAGAASPACRCRTHRAAGRISHTMHRRPAIGRVGWLLTRHSLYVRSA